MLKRIKKFIYSDRQKQSTPTLVALGISLTFLAGCGQSGTRAIDVYSSSPSAATAPAHDAKETAMTTDSTAQEDNPFAPAGITDPAAFIQMFKAMQAAVAAGDKAAVAKLILLPLHVNGTNPFVINTKEQFITSYDVIMTEPVKNALAVQKVEELFVRDQGVMVGNGELWFGATQGEPQTYGLIAVNPM
ncbi:hypothetical protein [Paenibacillus sinopodophylli]|uniref:hypothetical protein n=1 Tax=Paenibacillus sinopodophylli TaxID=1837342 RepID=UPI00110D150A|nr:hypothetical protein [Paenibacillus sinopodophylli]